VKEQLVYLGVDIAKSYLDAAIGSEKRRFSNDAIGHRELIKWVKQVKTSVQVICESSGGYERALVQGLARARVKISLVPSQPGTAICPSGRYFGQDRSNRCRGAV
jgi:transposase